MYLYTYKCTYRYTCTYIYTYIYIRMKDVAHYKCVHETHVYIHIRYMNVP